MAGALLLLAMTGAGVLLGGPPVWLIDWLAARYPGCLYRVPEQRRVVALTLDDGPDSITTPLILDELRRHNARATFFLIADRVESQEALVRRVVAEGHEIGNHFTQDRPSIRLSAAEFTDDLEQADRVLASYGTVRWARPGSGWYSQGMIAALAAKGYRCALGSVYPYDTTIPSVEFATWHIRRNVRPGAVLVLHDGGEKGQRTVRVLQKVLPWLVQQGYGVVSLSALTVDC
ncbi:MAG TPA: polysaccharide deacetylase family protein [Gemmatimonadales bacterium]|nr:polysaccharide deacetylase family protein [Gemmatimonadales bacterium]